MKAPVAIQQCLWKIPGGVDFNYAPLAVFPPGANPVAELVNHQQWAQIKQELLDCEHALAKSLLLPPSDAEAELKHLLERQITVFVGSAVEMWYHQKQNTGIAP